MKNVPIQIHSSNGRSMPSLTRRSALRYFGIGAAAAAGAPVLQHVSAQSAGNAPVWHLGTFSRNLCPGYSFGIAREAVFNYGLTIEFESGQGDTGVVVGRNAAVEVFVVSMAQGDGSTWFAVHAASSDSVTAENARNSIRTDIADTIFFDCG